MFISKYFLPLLKENPVESSIVSHQLMLRSGMIRQLGSGSYNWLPLGLRVLRKVEDIVRQEMNQAQALEVLTPTVQPAELWKKSGRYQDGGDLAEETLVAKDRHGHELIFSPTAEEVITQLFAQNTQSYRELPKNIYQISWKFRDEIRPRYGVMRSREFLMKDAYSFDLSEKDSLATYERMLLAYLKIYRRMGLNAIPVRASTGSIGGSYSHEMHIIANTGESTIYYDKAILEALNDQNCNLELLESFYASEEEKHIPNLCNVNPNDLCNSKGIEVGHLFYLGDKYSKGMDVKIQTANGTQIHPQMGCYGIGVSRLVGALIEVNHDQDGIVWPVAVAPFQCVLINIRVGDSECDQASLKIYQQLTNNGIEVIYDDTNDSAGIKFAKANLIGIPLQVVVGPRGLKNGIVEVNLRNKNQEKEQIMVGIDNLPRAISDLLAKI